MKDRKRYSEAFKLKVMEELRDAKWKSVQEAARAYGIAEMSVYNWMHRLGFEHLKGRLIYVRTGASRPADFVRTVVLNDESFVP